MLGCEELLVGAIPIVLLERVRLWSVRCGGYLVGERIYLMVVCFVLFLRVRFLLFVFSFGERRGG